MPPSDLMRKTPVDGIFASKKKNLTTYEQNEKGRNSEEISEASCCVLRKKKKL